MNRFKSFIALFLCLVMGVPSMVAAPFTRSKMETLKGGSDHPFCALTHGNAFEKAQFMAPVLKASPAASNEAPDLSISGANGWGTLVGPDGKDWFFTQTFTMSTTNKYYYGGSTITIYNATYEKVGEINVVIPESETVNQIQPFGTITKSFFERNTNTFEVLVYIHKILSPGVDSADIAVYDNNGSNVITYTGASGALMVSEGDNDWTRKERLVLSYNERVTEGEETNEIVRFDVMRKATWGDSGTSPVVEHTFTIDYNTIHYTDGSTFDARYIDGKFYYILSHYEKPFVESYDYNTGSMVFTADNNFITEVYDQSFEILTQVKVPIVQEGFMPSMHGFNLFTDYDISKGLFTGDDQINLVITHYDYDVATDSYTYAFEVYDQEGKSVKTIFRGAAGWQALSHIDGVSDMIAFLVSEDGSQAYKVVTIPDCELSVTIPAVLDGKRISTSFDRIAVGNGFKYLIGIGEGGSDEEGNVIGSVAWYNPDLTLDRYVEFNIGKYGELFNPIIYNDYVKPYLFDTDDEFEYIFIEKIRRADGSGKVDNILCIGNEDGSIIRQFMGDATNGAYSNGSILNGGTTTPSLFVVYQNTTTNQFKVDFYDLPLEKFAGGEGTKENPYHIASVGDFMQIENNPKAYYVLDKDLDFSGVSNWLPVTLEGGFDGGNHAITGLNITDGGTSDCGLFGTVTGSETNQAYLKNLLIIKPQISGNDGNTSLGTLAGAVVATDIENVHVYSPRINWDSDYASSIGGIVGSASYKSTITNCTADDVISTSINASQVGGIAGSLGNASHIKNCVASITANGRSVIGGITGEAGGYSSEGSIINCHATVDINGGNTLGGITGSSGRILIENCYAKGKIVATCPEYNDRTNPVYSVGGIIGTISTDWNNSSTKVVKSCVAALTSIKVDDPENTSSTYLSLNRIIGSVVDDLGMGMTEKGIANCYATKEMTINGKTVTSDNAESPAGANMSLTGYDAYHSFFSGIGYAYGDNAAAPWVGTEYPTLYFEKVKYMAFDNEIVEIEPGAYFTVNLGVYSSKASEVSVESSDYDIVGFSIRKDNNIYTLELRGKAKGHATITATDKETGMTATCVVYVGEPAGVEEIGIDKTTIAISGNVITANGASQIKVYNLAGVCVAESATSSLEVANIAGGIYIAVATDEIGNRSTLKFMKK